VVVEARILLVGYIEVRQVTLAGYNSSGGATLVVLSQCSITRESIQRIVATSSALEALDVMGVARATARSRRVADRSIDREKSRGGGEECSSQVLRCNVREVGGG